MPEPSTSAESAFRAHERLIWGLCYRMTGCAADADDLTQETFVRALERPPARLDEDLRPWLVRVAVNLGRDHYRRRKRRRYDGPWLPSPVEDEEPLPAYEPRDTEGRYDLVESVSYAFLLALEALKPNERAVLLLCDVLDCSVREAAAALGLSEANVKTVHHRARKAMAAYDRSRRPTAPRSAQTREALEKFLVALSTGDAAALEALVAGDVRAISDGGGEFHAARVVVGGRSKVLRMYQHLAQRRGAGAAARPALVNGLPAFVIDAPAALPGEARRFVLRVELDGAGRIVEIHAILATRKLTGVKPG